MHLPKDSRHKLLLRTAVVIGLLALASCKKSSKPGESSGDNAKPRTAASPGPGDGKAAQPPLITRLPGEPVPVSHGVMLDISSDHGAQLLLMDSQGRRT